MDTSYLRIALTLTLLLAAGCGGAVVDGEDGGSTGSDNAAASSRPCAAGDEGCPGPTPCDPADTACPWVACPPDDPGCARVPPSCDPSATDCNPPASECRTAEDCPAPASPLCEASCDGGRCGMRCPPPVPACDDGTEAICDRRPPVCADDELLAVQDGCEICVDPATCRPREPAECRSPDDCPAPDGPGCYATCKGGQCGISCAHQVECRAADECPQPDGPFCYATCIDGLCGAECRRPCGDGTEVICRSAEPQCADGLLLAIQGGCWACVDPTTCTSPDVDAAP